MVITLSPPLDMIARIATVAFVASLTVPLFGCDKPGEKEQNAEGRANMQAQQAQEQAATAQAQAQEDIGGARMDFAKTRDDYRSSRENDLADLNRKLVELDGRERAATGQTKANLDQKLPALHAQRNAFVADLESLDSATSATWDLAKDALDREWDAFKTNVNEVY